MVTGSPGSTRKAGMGRPDTGWLVLTLRPRLGSLRLTSFLLLLAVRQALRGQGFEDVWLDLPLT